MKSILIVYSVLLALLNASSVALHPPYKPKSHQELKEGLLNGSISLGSLRDSGEHVMALDILRDITREQREKEQGSPRAKKANDIIEELTAYKIFRNDADASAQLCLKQAAKALNELIELDKDSQSNP